jgi:hypothetical protein
VTEIKQTKVDSFFEAVTNTAIGFVISMATWHFVALGFGIPMPIITNLQITAIFTIVSIVRQYWLRRAFNGRTPWRALKGLFVRPKVDLHLALSVPVGEKVIIDLLRQRPGEVRDIAGAK